MLGAGCGGGDGGGATAKDEPKFSSADEPPDLFIERMAKLLATTTAKKDCAQLDEINGRSYARFSCPPDKALRRSMASFKLVGAKAYGTGAIADYKSGKLKDGATIVLFVAPDRKWGVARFGVITKPSIGTSDETSRAGYDKAVEDYLTAVRARDCAAFKQVAFTFGVKDGDVCKKSFAGTESLAKRLKRNPSAEPDYLGGNGTYGFYSLETQKPAPTTNLTMSVIKNEGDTAKPYLVLDVAPSPTAADQREVIREFRRQQREKKNGKDQPPSSPSRKADS